jgi:P4 family phage/plasmid primase-like protien
MTYTLPYRYTPEKAGHMPMFDQFLNDSWATDADYGDKLLALQEMLGVSLMGKAPQFQMAFLLFGQAGAGKSVLQAIMRGLMPIGSSSAVSPSDWADRFLPAEMFGKIINFAGELSETRTIPGDIFKKVVSGEEMQVQFKNQSPFVFEPDCAQWFNSNHLPKTRDSSEGFNRRWLIIEFNNRIPADKRIVDLDAQILEHEREAIVAWAIQGYRRLMEKNNYTFPTSHLALIEQMAADNNSVRHFLSSTGTGLKWGKDQQIALADLHTQYWQFSIATGNATRVNVTKFTKLMKELSGTFPFEIDIRGKNEVFYIGLGV